MAAMGYGGMSAFPCPNCASKKTNTIDCRLAEAPVVHFRRRRACPACGQRFTTRELLADKDDLFGFLVEGLDDE